MHKSTNIHRPGKSKGQPIANTADLAEGHSVKFECIRDGKRVHGFLVHHKDGFSAFENRCMHLPLSLDYGDNQFFTEDGCHLICKTHNAVYEPDTGLCIQGPCTGASLIKLPIQIENGKVWLESREPGRVKYE